MPNENRESDRRFRLTGQRIFLLAFVAVMLALATSTILATFDQWRAEDAAATAPAAPPQPD